MQNSRKEAMTAEFEKNAIDVASQYSFDVNDVKAAYQDKPESLSVIFNSMSEAKSGRNRSIGWSVFWVIMLLPIALYTGYHAYKHDQKVSNIRDQVKDEIDQMRTKQTKQNVKGHMM